MLANISINAYFAVGIVNILTPLLQKNDSGIITNKSSRNSVINVIITARMSAFGINEDDRSDAPSTVSVLPTVGRILCCLCGASIVPNAVAMCTTCMQHQPEFLAFPSEMNHEITQCPKCDRWSVGMHNDHVWAAHPLESPGLLAACIKKIHTFQQHSHDIKILDATWIWTEPHSKRLKFYVDAERLLFEQRLPIRQRVIVTYIVKNSQCKDCIVKNSDHTWSAQLQVRQARGKEHTQNIEQILIQNKLGSLMNDVKMVRDGLDLYFDSKQSMERVQSVLQRALPCQVRSTAKKLVSRDTHTMVARTEHVVVLEVVPILKHDLVLLNRPHLSGKAVGIVRRVTSTIQISILSPAGPKTNIFSHHLSVTADKFFKNPLPVLLPAGQARYLTRFIVLDVNMLTTQFTQDEDTAFNSVATANTLSSGRLSRATVEVMSEADTEVQYQCETDIGHVLQPGDTVLAYDTQRLLLSSSESLGDDDTGVSDHTSSSSSSATVEWFATDGRENHLIPEVVIVSKVFDYDDFSGKKDKDGATQGKKRVSGGGGKKKRNRIPPWRKARDTNTDKDNQQDTVDKKIETIKEEEQEEEEEDIEDEEFENIDTHDDEYEHFEETDEVY